MNDFPEGKLGPSESGLLCLGSVHKYSYNRRSEPFHGPTSFHLLEVLKESAEVMSQNTMLQMLVMPTPEGGRYKATEVQIPVPGAGEVLIQVKASSVNRGETQSVLKHKDPSAKPLVTGIEFAGVIFAVGKDVQGWKVGDEVMTRSPAGFAQFAIAPVKSLMQSPAVFLGWRQAAFPCFYHCPRCVGDSWQHQECPKRIGHRWLLRGWRDGNSNG
jgi:threonine dehydrogenase-like Zn-dependent dehydrogenase